MAAIYITKKELKKFDACREGYRKLMRNIEHEPAEEVRIPIKLIYQTNGTWDALWALEQLALNVEECKDIKLPDEDKAWDKAEKAHPDPEYPEGVTFDNFWHPDTPQHKREEYWKARREVDELRDKAHQKLVEEELREILKGLKRA